MENNTTLKSAFVQEVNAFFKEMFSKYNLEQNEDLCLICVAIEKFHLETDPVPQCVGTTCAVGEEDLVTMAIEKMIEDGELDNLMMQVMKLRIAKSLGI